MSNRCLVVFGPWQGIDSLRSLRRNDQRYYGNSKKETKAAKSFGICQFLRVNLVELKLKMDFKG